MRSRLLLALCLCGTALFSHAQINKGSVLLGGSIGFLHEESQTNGDRKNNAVYFSPTFGMAVRQNLIAGIEVNYARQKNHLDPNGAQSDSKVYGGGVFVRRYFPVARSFYIFADADLGYMRTDYQYNYSSPSIDKRWTVSAALSPGLAYALTRKFHLELAFNSLVVLGYTEGKRTYSGLFEPEETKAFFASASASGFNNLTIGFRFVLPK